MMGLMDTVEKWFGSAEKPGEAASGAFDEVGDATGGAWEKAKDVAEDVKDELDGDDGGVAADVKAD